MLNKYTIDKSVYLNLDPKSWTEESYKLASTAVYKGIKENSSLPENYVEESNAIAEKQVVIGGYRLAYLLKSLNLGVKNTENLFL